MLLARQVISVDVLVFELLLAISTPNTLAGAFGLRTVSTVLGRFLRPARNLFSGPLLFKLFVKALEQTIQILQRFRSLDEAFQIARELTNILKVSVGELVFSLDGHRWWGKFIEDFEILDVRQPPDRGQIQIILVNSRQVEELSKPFLAGEHVVNLHARRFTLPGLTALVCLLEIFDRFVRVSLVEVLDVVQLLVELFKLIAGRDQLHFLLAQSFLIFVNLLEPLRLLLNSVQKLRNLMVTGKTVSNLGKHLVSARGRRKIAGRDTYISGWNSHAISNSLFQPFQILVDESLFFEQHLAVAVAN